MQVPESGLVQLPVRSVLASPLVFIQKVQKAKMNSAQTSLLILGLVLICGTYSGLAIKCYVCNSGANYDGEKCSNIEGDEFLVDCNKYAVDHNYPDLINATLCRKQDQTVEGEFRTVRACAIDGRLDRCVERTGTKAVKVKYCECEGDGCNSASSVISSILTLAVSALLARSLH